MHDYLLVLGVTQWQLRDQPNLGAYDTISLQGSMGQGALIYAPQDDLARQLVTAMLEASKLQAISQNVSKPALNFLIVLGFTEAELGQDFAQIPSRFYFPSPQDIISQPLHKKTIWHALRKALHG